MICAREHTWLLNQLMLSGHGGGACEQTESRLLHPISRSRASLLAGDKCETWARWRPRPGETDAPAPAELPVMTSQPPQAGAWQQEPLTDAQKTIRASSRETNNLSFSSKAQLSESNLKNVTAVN